MLDALHKIYVASLPDELQQRIRDRLRRGVWEMDLGVAFHTVAQSSDLDPLEKWHLALSFDRRRHDLVESDDGVARGVAALVVVGDEGRIDRAVDRLRSHDRSNGSREEEYADGRKAEEGV